MCSPSPTTTKGTRGSKRRNSSPTRVSRRCHHSDSNKSGADSSKNHVVAVMDCVMRGKSTRNVVPRCCHSTCCKM
jgi:hypothetical protein